MNQPDLRLKVTELRQQKNLTQEQLAEMCEVSKSYKIDKQGRQVLNFQITMTLMLFAALFLLMTVPIALAMMGDAGIVTTEGSPVFMLLVMCAPTPLILIGIFCTYQGVVNAMRALSDKPIRYPLTIPFVK